MAAILKLLISFVTSSQCKSYISDRIFIDLEIVRFFKATATCIFMSMKNIRARENSSGLMLAVKYCPLFSSLNIYVHVM